MLDFLTHLFDTSGFPPRWRCGVWTEGHGWLHILSDLGVWSAYVAIPCVLGYFVLRRKDIPFRTVFLLFGAFILACGSTHLMEAILFWWPAYRLAGVIKLLTAIVSWATVFALVGVVPKVLSMRSQEELEREIEQRTAELMKANKTLQAEVLERQRAEQESLRIREALKEADRRKDEFLATLAHELRNPLAPIRNGLQMMRMAANDNAAVEQARNMMDRQLTQLVRLVDDLIDVSRISRGKFDLRKEHVDLAAVVASAVETSRPLIEQMGHQLIVTLPQQPVVLDADLTRLAQVLLNLLSNAAKYTERGGQIWLTAERHDSELLFYVKDTGIGIAADHLPHIFEMFSQLDHSLAKAQGGLGIGLTLVKRLTEMHGGTVEARSNGIGTGSEFVVRLPIVLPVSGPQPAEKDGPAAAVKASLRILIVDDNRDSANSLSLMLQMMGHTTRTAYDGEAAVIAAAEFRPEVILLDIGLPKVTGYEACRRIRQAPGGAEIFIIAQTGWGQEEDRQRSQEVGFDHHLVKPVDPDILMELLAGLSKGVGNNSASRAP
jgi:signal transduction histidine kinase/ActR/RegA family two-component response regulator